jgi:hypothetical protein
MGVHKTDNFCSNDTLWLKPTLADLRQVIIGVFTEMQWADESDDEEEEESGEENNN